LALLAAVTVAVSRGRPSDTPASAAGSAPGTEKAITFVVVLGAAPAIANGVIAGVDHTPPILLQAGRILGAKGLAAYRHVVLPAALPGFVAGPSAGGGGC
jgi:ABC-type nitrate/sulfonate/bicarbonate transport system permease component